MVKAMRPAPRKIARQGDLQFVKDHIDEPLRCIRELLVGTDELEEESHVDSVALSDYNFATLIELYACFVNLPCVLEVMVHVLQHSKDRRLSKPSRMGMAAKRPSRLANISTRIRCRAILNLEHALRQPLSLVLKAVDLSADRLTSLILPMRVALDTKSIQGYHAIGELLGGCSIDDLDLLQAPLRHRLLGSLLRLFLHVFPEGQLAPSREPLRLGAAGISCQ